MTELEYLEAIIEDLEMELEEGEEITLDTKFRDLEDWSSLMGFSFLAFISENFNKDISPTDFMDLNTFREIYEKVTK